MQPHELLPDDRIIELGIAYEVVGLLQLPEQTRRDFLEHGREGRLGWWRFLHSWTDPAEPVEADFLKKHCELVEIPLKGFYLAVRGKVNPDNWTVEVDGKVFRADPERTVEVNGEVLHLLVNDSFGLSRNDLITLYPALAPNKNDGKEAKTIAMMKELYPPHGLPPEGDEGVEKQVRWRLETEKGFKVGHNTYSKALKAIREYCRRL